MTLAFESGRLARSLGIVIVFTIVGPFAATAVFGFFILLVGLPMLQIMLDLVDLQALNTWLSIAVFLLVFFALAAAVIPAILAGLAFAIASVYCGMNSLWVALAVAGVVVLGVVALGFFVSPSESSRYCCRA